MTKTKVFVDGRAGTTGLKIQSRLEQRSDIELLTLPENARKDLHARKEAINASGIVFLCLPDDAARESVSLIENENVKIIDASTAHRTEQGWAYGFPELSAAFRDKVKTGKRVAVPGCHASGFLSLAYPLIKEKIMPADYPVACQSLTGYSGGGNGMIGEYERGKITNYKLQITDEDGNYKSPRQYGLTQTHKHLKEMQAVSGLKHAPLFSPVVADFYCGMQVTVPLYSHLLKGVSSVKQIRDFFESYYAGQKLISALPGNFFPDGFIPSNICAGKDFLKIFVGGNDERILLIALFDNLGKGASGAAVQCMNIMLGAEETLGLNI